MFLNRPAASELQLARAHHSAVGTALGRRHSLEAGRLATESASRAAASAVSAALVSNLSRKVEAYRTAGDMAFDLATHGRTAINPRSGQGIMSALSEAHLVDRKYRMDPGLMEPTRQGAAMDASVARGRAASASGQPRLAGNALSTLEILVETARMNGDDALVEKSSQGAFSRACSVLDRNAAATAPSGPSAPLMLLAPMVPTAPAALAMGPSR